MIARYLQRARELPPRILVRKAVKVIARTGRYARRRVRDVLFSTYSNERVGPLAPVIPALPVGVLLGRHEEIAGVASQYLEHRFDVLGSGWVTVRHAMTCAGTLGHRYGAGAAPEGPRDWRWLASQIPLANRRRARQLWSLVHESYVPIDWHRDIKSGYRWSPLTWGPATVFGNVAGADVKVPWELGRLQHLPQLSIAYACAASGAGGFRPPLTYANEVRNQILDFVATNPPRYGVNWASAMDVAIRAANLLVAYDIIRHAGHAFDAAFVDAFAQSIRDHAVFVLEFLEWNEDLRGNHYLANLGGLALMAVALPSSPETDGWLAFAARELAAEVALQFHSDGSNFEGSTAYHRLSAEIVAWSVAALTRVAPKREAAVRAGRFVPAHVVAPGAALAPAELVPQSVVDALPGMAQFAADVTKPGEGIMLTGDNDSGRFVKLQPPYVRLTGSEAGSRYENLLAVPVALEGDVYWDETHDDVGQVIGAIHGLAGGVGAEAPASGTLERALFASVGPLRAIGTRVMRLPSDDVAAEPRIPLTYRQEWTAWQRSAEGDGVPITHGLRRYAYPDFGLCIWRSPRVFLAVRCGAVGQRGHGGHTHNDQLAIELSVDARAILRDPGTYLYTAAPVVRNAYRSVGAHDAPWVLDPAEPASLDGPLFQLPGARPGRVVACDDGTFVGELHAGDVIVRRTLRITDDSIVVTDEASRPLRALGSAAQPFAPGYGKRFR